MWIRSRFEMNVDDERPVKFPPPGPYWVTGYKCTDENDIPILVAYTKTEDEILKYWPEAENIESEKVDEIVFSGRFPKPDWWKE